MLQAALTYASYGWRVFPVHSITNGVCTCGNPNCQSPGKHPVASCAPNGFHQATIDPATLTRWWTERPWMNIAIATGSISGLVVVDLDVSHEPGADDSSATFADLGDCPDTVECYTGGGGRHLYFAYPSGQSIRSGTHVLGERIDIRADGGYVLLPPSNHISGADYDWEAASDPDDGVTVAPMPAWLLKELTKPKLDVTLQYAEFTLDQSQLNEIRSALMFINQDDYNDWLQIGMALKSTGAVAQAYGLWNEWSSQSSKYNPLTQRRTWDSIAVEGGISIATLFHMAKDAGWFEQEPVSVDDKVVVAQKRTSSTDPTGLDNPPGILNDIANYILDTAQRRQPVYAVNAALSLAAVVLGRRVAGVTGVRTNLYLISVGDTSSGKDHARQIIKMILNNNELNDLNGGENIASGAGLMTRVGMTPSVLFQLDEFGLFMQSLQGRGSGRHNVEILSNMMKLFSSSGSVYVGTEYANQTSSGRPRVEIAYPCVGIHATTTSGDLYDAFASKHIVSGYLNRFIIADISGAATPPRQRGAYVFDPPEEIDTWIRQASKFGEAAGNLGTFANTIAAHPLIIPRTKEADELMNQWDEKCDRLRVEHKDVGELWGRAWEHAEKVAIICACARDTESPKIAYNDALWAIRFVSYNIDRLAIEVAARVSDTEFERISKSFYRGILKTGLTGISKSDLGRRRPFSTLSPRDRESVIKSLVESNQIALVKVKHSGGGRPRLNYVAIQTKH